MKEKKPKPKKDLEFLKYLEEEDQMHDDHGPVIIGPREKKPKIPEENGNDKKPQR
jgi:hypothetical protein